MRKSIRDYLRVVLVFFNLTFFAREFKQILCKCFNLLGRFIFILFRISHLVPCSKSFKKDYIRNVLIIRLDKVGDVLLSTPLFRSIRQNLPGAEITLLIDSYTKDIVIRNPCIDKILAYGSMSALQILKQIRGLHFDLVLVLNDTFLGNAAALLSGASYIVGFDSNHSDFIMTHRINDDVYVNVKPCVETNLDFARFLNFKIKSKEIEISIEEKVDKFAQSFFDFHSVKKNDLVVCVHPGSWQPYIRWKKQRFAEVSDRLIREKNAKVILLGNDAEKALVEEVAYLMDEKPIFVMDMQLLEIVSIIRRCSLFIGNSTGPMHIAAGLKIPVVAIFGNIHPYDSYKRWGPWGEGHIVVSKNLNCKKCHPGDCRTFECMELITADDVFEAVDRQLERIDINTGIVQQDFDRIDSTNFAGRTY